MSVGIKISMPSGFILPVTLIFIQVFYFLSIAVFTNLYLSKKMNKQEIVQRDMEYFAKSLLLHYPDVLYKETENYQYQFSEEHLSQDDCADIENQAGLVADYYQITLNINSRSDITVSLQMKGILIKPVSRKKACQRAHHWVQPGVRNVI